jgi:hypothetical protein
MPKGESKMASHEDLVSAVKAGAVERDGRVTLRCSDAFQIADSLSATLAAIGQICNENGIRIIQCQLGCFQ